MALKRMAKQIITIGVEYDPTEFPAPHKWDWGDLADTPAVVLNHEPVEYFAKVEDE